MLAQCWTEQGGVRKRQYLKAIATSWRDKLSADERASHYSRNPRQGGKDYQPTRPVVLARHPNRSNADTTR
jgi:hypothetical protein